MSARHKRIRHPIQPMEWDGVGVLRFKQNRIVRYLLDVVAKRAGVDLNDLHRVSAEQGIPSEDWDQFNQLIGYSVSGCPIRSKVTLYDVDVRREAYLAKWPEDPEHGEAMAKKDGAP